MRMAAHGTLCGFFPVLSCAAPCAGKCRFRWTAWVPLRPPTPSRPLTPPIYFVHSGVSLQMLSSWQAPSHVQMLSLLIAVCTPRQTTSPLGMEGQAEKI